MQRAYIKAITSYFPEGKLSNEDLEKVYDGWNSRKILKKTGVNVRNISADGECASDLGIQAAEKLFATGVCSRGDIDFILVCTQSPDYFLPATACVMQDRLKLRKDIGALDINQGCSGFVYGLAVAKGMVETGVAENLLLLTQDTYSKYVHPLDRSVRTLFGDGAAATLISSRESDEAFIHSFVLGTDGSGADKLIVKAGGARCPKSMETCKEYVDDSGNTRTDEHIYMNGPDIMNFALENVPVLVEKTLELAHMEKNEVDFFVFHQGSKFMLDTLRMKLSIPKEQFWNHIEKTGNTISTTIPHALESAIQEDKIKSGDKVMLVGFGVGLSQAACMVRIV